MPRVPKWLGNTMEVVFSSQYKPVTVTSTEHLAPLLKKVRFEGDLSKTSYIPGNIVEFRVSETDFRHYTPSYYNAAEGVCEVLFYLHDKGPGSHWVQELATGDTTKLMGPGGKLSYNTASRYHFFFGDETSIGLYEAMKNHVHALHHEYLCILELEQDFQHWPALAGLSADAVSKSVAAPAQEAIRQLLEFKESSGKHWPIWQQGTFYLTGRAKSIQTFRKALLEAGVSIKNIRTEPYWADGKAGL
jgi:NADPH-dependent ferric siderophore reductase